MYSFCNFFVRSKTKVRQKYNKMSTPDRSKDTQEQLKEELAKAKRTAPWSWVPAPGPTTLPTPQLGNPRPCLTLQTSVSTPALYVGLEGRRGEVTRLTRGAPTPLRLRLQLHTRWVESKSPVAQVQGSPDCQVHSLPGAQILPSQALPSLPL